MASQNVTPPQSNYIKQGYLLKRQRGRYKKESERKKLKFRRRFCTLTKKHFYYRETEMDKKGKNFPVKKIKFIEDVAAGTFLDNQAEPLDFALCFQFGDEEEAIYAIASTMEDRQEWMIALRNTSENNGNQMLKCYHPGAYGSQRTEQWSCCLSDAKRQQGCMFVSDKTVLPHSSSTVSTVMDNQQSSNAHSLTRDRFSSASTSSVTSTETIGGESLTSSSSCYSISEDETSPSVHEIPTAGIQRARAIPLMPDWRRSTITINSMDSGVCMQSRPVSTYTNLSGNISGFSTPRDSWILQPQSDEGILDYEGPIVVPSKVIMNIKLVHSFKFSSSLLLIPSSTKLIAGTRDGMLWTLSQDCTEIQSAYLKVAGQITSLDSFGEYVAIGSAVVQLVKPSYSQSMAKRVIYRKAKDRLMISGRQHFVAFLGETGMLATAQLHGDSIDIWPPPSDTHLMMNPKSSISTSGKILSLSASSKSNSPLISMLLEVVQEKKTKLMVVNWKNICDEQCAPLKGSSANGSHLAFFPDGRNIAIAEDSCLQVYDASAMLNLKASISFDAAISCLSSWTSVVDNQIGVGLITGNFIICSYVEGALIQTQYGCNTNDMSNSPVVSISFVGDLGLCIAHRDGVLQLWKASSDVDSDHQVILQEKSILGMELHQKGILSVPKIIEQTKTEQKIGHGIYITLPQEVIDENIQVESAFRPCGLGHHSFILPDKMLPISQAVWLCATPQKKFKDPAKIKLEHCFQSEDKKHQKLITFLKADHEDIDRDENGQVSIKFKAIERSQSRFPSSSYGILLDQHFCVYCLAVYCEEKEILGKVNYCLTILKPSAYPREKAAKVYCILHFDLEGCKQLIQEQIPEDYAPIVEKQFQFEMGRYESALEIQIDDEQATRRGWKISMESERKVYAEDVNFFNYRNIACLEAACYSPLNKHYPYMYPPRFVLEISSQTGAVSYLSESIIRLTFTGAKRELSTDIQLNILRDERDLNQPGVSDDRSEDYCGPATNEPHPFTAGINGMWQINN